MMLNKIITLASALIISSCSGDVDLNSVNESNFQASQENKDDSTDSDEDVVFGEPVMINGGLLTCTIQEVKTKLVCNGNMQHENFKNIVFYDEIGKIDYTIVSIEDGVIILDLMRDPVQNSFVMEEMPKQTSENNAEIKEAGIQEDPIQELDAPAQMPSATPRYYISVNLINLNKDETVTLKLDLQDGQSELLSVNSNGLHSFNHPFTNQENYSVVISAQASNQSCYVRSGTGKIDNADKNLDIECATHTIIEGTFSWDVETNSLSAEEEIADFWWEQDSATIRALVPSNGTLAALEAEEAFENIDSNFVQNSRLNDESLSGSDINPDLVPGSVVIFRTSEGRFGKLQVVEYLPMQNVINYHLKVAWRLFD